MPERLKAISSLFFLILFMTHLALSVSLSACEPLTESCCCIDIDQLSLSCVQSIAGSGDNCCTMDAVEQHGETHCDCFCDIDTALPAYVTPLVPIVEPVRYLALVEHFLKDFSLSINSLLNEQLRGFDNEVSPEIANNNFALVVWPTVRLLC